MLDQMQFAGAWRDYQARVLQEMDDHLGDARLHVVAAPGAGKTVLGLEIVRRLGRPALIFAPSLAIRDQWRERLTPLFMPQLPAGEPGDEPDDEDVSRDLSDPRTLTLSTYQSLDSYRRSDDLTDLIAKLNAAGPFTLVLDEAHHLRKAWWDCLNRLANELTDVKIVALTATPPYDASLAEWNRYETLCGPIDLEIGIPELVRNGDLCPHQDHVILSEPTADALELLEQRQNAISQLQDDLRSDEEWLNWLAAHPWLTAPEEHVEAILDAPEMLSAALVLLGSVGRPLPAGPLKLLGVSAKEMPMPSLFWLERLLDGLLFEHKDAFPLEKKRRDALSRRLHKEGLIEGKRVSLRHTRSVFRLLASSLGKIDSICDIAEQEEASLSDRLRMVVLTDHIRAGELPKRSSDDFTPAKLGVVPIFESLRRRGGDDRRLAVLTGSLVMIPRGAEAMLDTVCADLRLERERIRVSTVPPCPNHIELRSAHSADLTRLVTALFQRGEIRILVGTQSLLGQGWDAPALNSLVLASNTASFVLSNQMRGRAIRVNPKDPKKVANIWHLATIEPGMQDLSHAIETSLDWGIMDDKRDGSLTDIGTVARRFRAFECISNGASLMIESGLGRLGLNPAMPLRKQNEASFALARNRESTDQKWLTSLGTGQTRSAVRETATPNYAPRGLHWPNTLQSLVWTAGGSAAFAASEQLASAATQPGPWYVGMGIAGVATLASLPRLLQAGRLMWRNGSLEGSLKQVAGVVIESLKSAGAISAHDAESARVKVKATMKGRHDVIVAGVSRAAERQIMSAIAEILGPVQNPRYLLVRGSKLGFIGRTDYHAVPSNLGHRKESAETFAELWNKRVGASQLIYTRSSEGRRWLLKARTRSFAAGFQRAVDRRSAWV
ncbi:MAG: DEAD/DEAH box helicase family protein [Pseudomonadota bacterium]